MKNINVADKEEGGGFRSVAPLNAGYRNVCERF